MFLFVDDNAGFLYLKTVTDPGTGEDVLILASISSADFQNIPVDILASMGYSASPVDANFSNLSPEVRASLQYQTSLLSSSFGLNGPIVLYQTVIEPELLGVSTGTFNPSVLFGATLQAEILEIQAQAPNASISILQRVSIDALAEFTTNVVDPTLRGGATTNTILQQITLSPVSPKLSAGATTTTDSLQLTLSLFPSEVQLPKTIIADAVSSNFDINNPVLSLTARLVVDIATSFFDTFDPRVFAGVIFEADVFNISLQVYKYLIGEAQYEYFDIQTKVNIQEDLRTFIAEAKPFEVMYNTTETKSVRLESAKYFEVEMNYRKTNGG